MQKNKFDISKKLKKYIPILETIKEINLKKHSDSQLKEISKNYKKLVLINNNSLDEILIKSFALVCEISKRTLGIFPNNMQILGAIALHNGNIIDMKTGEGKTLTAVMPVYLNSLTGKGVHVLTFNDYLAHRDCKWMKAIYDFVGVSVSYISEGMSISERQKAYNSDITYITAKESGFDYLRDFTCFNKENLVHRPFNFAIVDEADSILIDEARVPLVLAGKDLSDYPKLKEYSKLVKCLDLNDDVELSDDKDNVYLTDKGIYKVENALNCGNLFLEKNFNILSYINCALHAEFLLTRDIDYIVKNNKIEIIDEFTGRISLNRKWPNKLHMAVESKENIINEEHGIILNSITIQHFINLYPKIAGMTGTAITSKNEFFDVYSLEVIEIPTNKPCIRIDHDDIIFSDKTSKYSAIIDEIERVYIKKQPILIGTENIEESEIIASLLNSKKIPYNLLNAKNDEVEAEIIAEAGELGKVTISTNMAGRGVDIKLGGENVEYKKEISSLGGLYVLGTNRFESKRIDKQLIGRSGRQGDPGETRFFLSLEDSIVQRFSQTGLIPIMDDSEKKLLIKKSKAQGIINLGQRLLEGYNSDIRSQIYKYSYITEEQRKIISKKYMNILLKEEPLNILKTNEPVYYKKALSKTSINSINNIEKYISLYHISNLWSEYLDYIQYERESIHLVIFGNKNPLTEFYRISIEAFDILLKNTDTSILNTLKSIDFSKTLDKLKKEVLKLPSSTWTYLINENFDQFSLLPKLIKNTSLKIKIQLFSLKSLLEKLRNRAIKLNKG